MKSAIIGQSELNKIFWIELKNPPKKDLWKKLIVHLGYMFVTTTSVENRKNWFPKVGVGESFLKKVSKTIS